MILPIQIKAARALLEWDQKRLAAEAGLSLPTIQRMEKLGLGRSSADNAERIEAAFTRAGVEFLNHGSPGARLRSGAPDA